jgi:hypothetical protein
MFLTTKACVGPFAAPVTHSLASLVRGRKFDRIYPAVSGRHGQNGEASGLVPEVLHHTAPEPDTLAGPHGSGFLSGTLGGTAQNQALPSPAGVFSG